MDTTEIVDILQSLVAIPSTADRPEALEKVIAFAENYFAIPELVTERFTSNGKVNLLVRDSTKKDREFDVILNGHLDVVPAKDEQFALDIKEGNAYGRGVFDMKGGAAVLMKLYKDMARAGGTGSTALSLVTDEEIGGHNGVKYLLEQQNVHGKFFLVAEPTNFDICHQQKGILWLELVESGRPAHGSRPWEGQNANVSLAHKIAAFYASTPQPSSKDDWKTSYTLSILRGGGEAKNVVADQATAYFDIRRVESESADSIRDTMRTAFTNTQINTLLDEPCLDTDPDDHYVKTLAHAVEATVHKKPAYTRETFGSDARFYSALGVPSVNFGPVGGDMHGDAEWVNVESLGTFYEILKNFFASL